MVGGAEPEIEVHHGKATVCLCLSFPSQYGRARWGQVCPGFHGPLIGGGVEQGGHPSPAGSSEKGLSFGPQGVRWGIGGNSPSLLRHRNKDLEDMGLGLPEALWEREGDVRL